MQTGSLEFIRDEALRLSVVTYFDQGGSVFSRNYDQLLEEVFDLQDLLNPYLRPDIAEGSNSLWEYPSNARRLGAPWDEVRRDNALMLQMLEFGIYAGYMADLAAQRMDDNRELVDAIRNELGPLE